MPCIPLNSNSSRQGAGRHEEFPETRHIIIIIIINIALQYKYVMT